tara:strand:+ start:459 stop:590 length:132 start_codon:yes stop_codon:yes gene_type:complete
MISLSYGQKLDLVDIQLERLENLIQNSSRSSQRVFVEDFTGLN